MLQERVMFGPSFRTNGYPFRLNSFKDNFSHVPRMPVFCNLPRLPRFAALIVTIVGADDALAGGQFLIKFPQFGVLQLAKLQDDVSVGAVGAGSCLNTLEKNIIVTSEYAWA